MNKKRGDFVVRWRRLGSSVFVFHAFFSLNLENAVSYELCIITMATQPERSYAFCYLKLQYMILTFG